MDSDDLEQPIEDGRSALRVSKCELGSGDSVPDTDPAAFPGTFRAARATGMFAGTELDYGFRTRGTATSDLGFAELGFERNGVFLD